MNLFSLPIPYFIHVLKSSHAVHCFEKIQNVGKANGSSIW